MSFDDTDYDDLNADPYVPPLSDIVYLPPVAEMVSDCCDYLIGKEGEQDLYTGTQLLCTFLMHGMVPILDGCGLYSVASRVREACVIVLQDEDVYLYDIQAVGSLPLTCEFLFHEVERLDEVASLDLGSELCVSVLKDVLDRSVDVFESLQLDVVSRHLLNAIQILGKR